MLLTAIVLAACSDSNPTSPGGKPDGTYQLVTVDGQPLPYLIPRDFPSADERIRSGSHLVISGFSWRLTWLREWQDESGTVIPGSQREDVGSGMFFVRSGGLAIDFTTGDMTIMAAGTLSNSTLTVVGTAVFSESAWLQPRVLVFRR